MSLGISITDSKFGKGNIICTHIRTKQDTDMSFRDSRFILLHIFHRA